jgi:hypothetical protein
LGLVTYHKYILQALRKTGPLTVKVLQQVETTLLGLLEAIGEQPHVWRTLDAVASAAGAAIVCAHSAVADAEARISSRSQSSGTAPNAREVAELLEARCSDVLHVVSSKALTGLSAKLEAAVHSEANLTLSVLEECRHILLPALESSDAFRLRAVASNTRSVLDSAQKRIEDARHQSAGAGGGRSKARPVDAATAAAAAQAMLQSLTQNQPSRLAAQSDTVQANSIAATSAIQPGDPIADLLQPMSHDLGISSDVAAQSGSLMDPLQGLFGPDAVGPTYITPLQMRSIVPSQGSLSAADPLQRFLHPMSSMTSAVCPPSATPSPAKVPHHLAQVHTSPSPDNGAVSQATVQASLESILKPMQPTIKQVGAVTRAPEIVPKRQAQSSPSPVSAANPLAALEASLERFMVPMRPIEPVDAVPSLAARQVSHPLSNAVVQAVSPMPSLALGSLCAQAIGPVSYPRPPPAQIHPFAGPQPAQMLCAPAGQLSELFPGPVTTPGLANACPQVPPQQPPTLPPVGRSQAPNSAVELKEAHALTGSGLHRPAGLALAAQPADTLTTALRDDSATQPDGGRGAKSRERATRHDNTITGAVANNLGLALLPASISSQTSFEAGHSNATGPPGAQTHGEAPHVPRNSQPMAPSGGIGASAGSKDAEDPGLALWAMLSTG